MNRISWLLLVALALITFLSFPSIASDDTADEAIEPLRQAFNNLYTSIQNQGGMREDDRPTLVRLRDRFTEFNAEHADDKLGLTYELQLSIWLADNDRVDALFGTLNRLSPDDEKLGMAWADYFIKQNDFTKADRAYAELLVQYPDDADLRVQYAQRLKDRNLYGRVIEIMGRFEFDYATNPEAAALLADAFIAQQRFEEAIETLESIPEELPTDKLSVKSEAADKLDTARQLLLDWNVEQEIRAQEAEANDLPRAQIVTTKGTILIELFENEAPNTVANFISLAEEKFYHGSTFHRVEKNFMAQGGDPFSKPGSTGEPGKGNPGYYIKDEHNQENVRKHFAGSLAMAKMPIPNTAGCQFFITVTPTPWLDGKHTVFGRVVEGLTVARQLVPGDRIEVVMVLRKRDHEYVVEKLPLSSGPKPIEIGKPVSGNAGGDGQ